MPYSSNSSLPPAVKKLSAKLQTAFRKAFNNAYKEYGEEKKAFATAWSVVNKMKGKKALDLDPRMDLIETLGDIEVYRVNGEMVRDSQGGEEFTNWGTHSLFNFIPVGEFWLDEDAAEDETDFFIEAARMYEKCREAGMEHDKALACSNRKEQAMRDKVEGTPVGDSGITHAPELQTVETLDDGVVVKNVDGDWVRHNKYINWTEGGHDLIYKFIPENTIWLDNANEPQEQPYILLHEKTERADMAKGTPYIEAHKRASQVEYDERSNLWEVDKTNIARVGAKASGEVPSEWMDEWKSYAVSVPT